MKRLSFHPIASWRRHHNSRQGQRQSYVVQACADELAVIVEHRRSLIGG